MSHVETQTLFQRMGELHHRGQEASGFWIRDYLGRVNSFGGNGLKGFELDYNGVQLGVDKHFRYASGDMFAGLLAGFAKADSAYDVGDSSLKNYNGGLYATYNHHNGGYVDGVLRYMQMRHQFTTQTSAGHAIRGRGTTRGLSVGVEVGQRFYFSAEQQGLFVEPQVQLTYSYQNSVDIHASNGLRTTLGRYHSTIGRLSSTLGYRLGEDKTPIFIYWKWGFLHEFAGRTDYTFNQSQRFSYDFGGTWWDNGIGINATFSHRHHLYAEADYSKGNRFDKRQLHLGYRYTF